jgi:hypothetical protein
MVHSRDAVWDSSIEATLSGVLDRVMDRTGNGFSLLRSFSRCKMSATSKRTTINPPRLTPSNNAVFADLESALDSCFDPELEPITVLLPCIGDWLGVSEACAD